MKEKKFKYVPLSDLENEKKIEEIDHITEEFKDLHTDNISKITKSISNLSVKDSTTINNTSTLNTSVNETLVRKCDLNCRIPDNWGLLLHEALHKLNPNKNFHDLQKEIMDFEYCNKCFQENYPACDLKGKCKDYIKFLRVLAPHFQHIRTLLRRVYIIRSICIWLTKLDEIYFIGDYSELKKFIQTVPNKVFKLFNYLNNFIISNLILYF